jgi:AcrR family transcriptional regulator
MEVRQQIKEVATDLFVARGFNGMSFADIAERIGTTRANIHHHFGSKMGLAEEVLADAAALVLDRYGGIFTDMRASLRQKLLASLEFNRERYARYNPRDEGRPWSLITRFRLDAGHLSDRILADLARVSAQIDALVEVAVRLAIESGEFRPETPVRSVKTQLATLLRFNQFVVTDAGTFQALADLYHAIIETIETAYGTQR